MKKEDGGGVKPVFGMLHRKQYTRSVIEEHNYCTKLSLIIQSFDIKHSLRGESLFIHSSKDEETVLLCNN